LLRVELHQQHLEQLFYYNWGIGDPHNLVDLNI